MRKSILCLAVAALATLVLGGRSAAQPPDRRGGPPRRGGPGSGLERVVFDLNLSETKRATAIAAVREYQDNGRRLTDLAGAALMLQMKEILSPEEFKTLREATSRFRAGPFGAFRPGLGVEDVVERIMSFDKDKDGKVTKDELPERLQYLIEKGDTNKDGALDRDEITRLAADLARDRSVPGRGPRGRGRLGALGGPGGGLPLPVIERAVNDLKVSEPKKEAASAAVKASQENTRKLTELARADLLLKMDEILSAEDFKRFKTALDREPGFGARPGGRDRRPPRDGLR
jgi:hypothetical protein